MTGEGSPAAETEKNGCVKVKLPEDQEEGLKFTGLSKEELLKVAGTPGWVRTRWALLILFWLGWLGMLAAAIAIIVQAPRCKLVPEQSWWHKGALYRIGAVAAFMDSNGDGTGDLAGHMASLVPQRLLGVYHTLLFTIPGTPVTNYGDEIGLRDEPGQAQKSDPQSLLSLYRSLSDLKGKERSLLYGEFQPLLSSSSSVFSYLRRWDQSERFLVALNFGESPAEVTLQDPLVPPEATVVLSSDPSRQAGVSLGLEKLTLHPSEALLLKFPYVA
ncbi:4F2 cell-surface antigen heavy chain [Acipenser ruthenus]|uniref:4F2 cell-surface antigen heavy chain n=1 Tax=Acipenser ruthenus TaxID=7906 RepID=A0A444UTP2_ACIRT|nr:4F2 cell-surface antigen heavy chain [Acipenser ruthenus]